jgi:uncharacterized membrane protein YtjA (UPF0391 family)
MPRYALVFLMLAALAAVLAFAVLAGIASILARVLFGLFLALAVGSFLWRRGA